MGRGRPGLRVKDPVEMHGFYAVDLVCAWRHFCYLTVTVGGIAQDRRGHLLWPWPFHYLWFLPPSANTIFSASRVSATLETEPGGGGRRLSPL